MSHHASRFVLLGGPGSGKGTHGLALAHHLQIPHLSTGAHFRDHIQRHTELGGLAQAYLNQGQLVPDALSIRLLHDLLESQPRQSGFVLDGYPRSLAQAQALHELLAAQGNGLTGVLFLQVSDEAIVERLSGRLTCFTCQQSFHTRFNPPPVAGECPTCHTPLTHRADDVPEVIRERLRVFHQQVGPILDYYRAANLLCTVPAEGTVSEVSHRVMAAAQQQATVSG